MKKILSLVIVLIAISQVNANGVDPNSPVGMSVVKSGSLVKLFYKGEEAGEVQVKIYNENGKIIYTETLQDQEGFMRPYNFSSLPEGEYTIELTDSHGKRREKVMHDLSPEKRIAHLTRLNDSENKYMLAVPNDGRDALTVRIYDDTNKLVYQETEVIGGDFAKIYNLTTVAGEHRFEITDQDGRVNQFIR